MAQIGIHGIGTYLPPQVRGNDWWPSTVVDKWRQKANAKLLRAATSPEATETEGQARMVAAMAAQGDDPFFGCRERRVLEAGRTSTEMELPAANEALARANVDPSEIDLLLTYTTTPQFAVAPEFGVLHRGLGLRPSCMSTTTDAVCNAFAIQLTLAAGMIAGGRVRYALLVQSSAISRLLDPEDPTSTLFSDAASAVVVGPVAERHGLIGYAHGTDGAFHGGLVCGVPGGTWYDEGRVVAWSQDARVGRKMVLNLADQTRQIVGDALIDAKVTADEIDFYASHQPTDWLRRLTQQYAGLTNARGVDTFPWTGSLMPCNVPFQLAIGEREGLLGEGDLVATYTGGSGASWAGLIMRWGGHT
ncbi:MAG TPA: 3-oxoacyl-[acyl-carrier-protein] synthase III C-terminal domain-containing protein [Polyangia bacterium]|nr:3-oxoacyl-[acyl-carrier-protein] synthase III C-terminal domain-containing protein [Polyangia bacterium]